MEGQTAAVIQWEIPLTCLILACSTHQVGSHGWVPRQVMRLHMQHIQSLCLLLSLIKWQLQSKLLADRRMLSARISIQGLNACFCFLKGPQYEVPNAENIDGVLLQA